MPLSRLDEFLAHWNGDATPDAESGIVRIQQTGLMPQDRVWTPEVYFQLGLTDF